MDAPDPSDDFRRPGEAAREPMPDDVVWHLGWAVGMATTAAGLLAIAGLVPARVLLALSFMAVPGIIGAVWRPRAEERFALLALWSLGAALAVCVTGGLSGPLAVLCVTPVLACLAIGGSWRAGAGLSIAAVLFCALVGALHMLPRPPADAGRGALTLIALLVTAAAAGGALLVAYRRTEEDRAEADAELTAFQSLLGDLPELALAMDADGRTEAVFGQPLDGLDMDALHAGLPKAAVAADRGKLDAAIDQAFDKGSAQVTFSSAAAPDQRIAAVLQRTSTGGLTAILRKAPEPVTITALGSGVVAAAPPPADDLAARLNVAEEGRREAERGRDRAEATATARARFLANMSHELRTPLNAIMGFSDMMRAKMFGELPPKYAEYADLIHESGGHLLDLINDVLDMSKIEAQRYTLSREVFDVREALTAALRLMRLQADDAGVKLRAVLPPEPLMVDADKRAIKQIALNLLSNALKFTPKDGTVILTAQVRKAAARDLEIVVADTGMGIAADDLKRLGQPFEQAGGSEDRARGTGLGLSLVDAFAKLHGGQLTLESRLGEGTAATVRMPVLIETAAAEPPAPEPAAAPVISAPAEPAQPSPPPAEIVQPVIESTPTPVAPPAPPLPEPPIAADPEFVQEPAVETPASAPALGALGPLDARAVEHHGLRQTVIDLFAHRPSHRSEP